MEVQARPAISIFFTRGVVLAGILARGHNSVLEPAKIVEVQARPMNIFFTPCLYYLAL
jgi:hypothetical protein